ncbi:MAG: tetratricopeptide repeat protein [Sulfurimonas sp.]|uniref:tetratricopeptide repeat protein n=1 Tax=Sulfurimonas sp. TaxID=2022749 RepID=UPI0025FFAAD8|nr:tetratricopeptide repeat protein [Sulfurimonas sp.]MCK9492410.1 tetratricopeptide repeat protein [Sulfurimonas sp.]
MKSIYLAAIFAAIVPLKLLSSEPSAFGAGNLDNPQPYGLSQSEKVILQTKDKLNKVVVKSNNQANEVESLRERIDGLQTIIEGLTRKAQENKLSLQELETKSNQELENASEYEKRLSDVSQTNALEIQEIKQTLDKANVLLEAIESSYVTKEEYNTLVGDFNKFKELVSKELNKNVEKKSSKFDKISNAEIEKLAKENYDKKHYTKSIEYYTHLIDNNYRPARAHYMIGEMNYYRKNYAEAIAYFKKSASLYSKADYMPTLMLHTAISMQETSDEKNAKSFYKGVISKYPDSKEASIAKTNLSKMK